MFKSISYAAFAALLFFAGSANASTYIITLDPANIQSSSFVSTNAALANNVALAPTSATGVWGITNTSVVNQYLAPENVIPEHNYLYVQEAGSNATYSLNSHNFGMTWGSIDIYNTLTLGDSTGHTFTITGTDLMAILAPVQALLIPNGVSNSINYGVQADVLFKDIYGMITSAVLTTGQPAFEIVNLSTSTVPLPPALLLFASALIAAASFSMYKKARSGI